MMRVVPNIARCKSGTLGKAGPMFQVEYLSKVQTPRIISWRLSSIRTEFPSSFEIILGLELVWSFHRGPISRWCVIVLHSRPERTFGRWYELRFHLQFA